MSAIHHKQPCTVTRTAAHIQYRPLLNTPANKNIGRQNSNKFQVMDVIWLWG
ncbi:MAG: hypothetical protein LUQ65_14070 [Candidatus Helarchaeota archaeon]|nr:hypothetical protein [Candidatus Helarchaeota archaeon]